MRSVMRGLACPIWAFSFHYLRIPVALPRARNVDGSSSSNWRYSYGEQLLRQ